MTAPNETVVITGSSGFIGQRLVEKMAPRFQVVGLDIAEPQQLPPHASFAPLDLTTDEGVRDALRQVRQRHGNRLASVIHLAAYFDLTGEPDPKYEAVTVRGTERLLRGLQAFTVEQLVFSSTMLVHAAGRPGERIDEERPLDPKLPYRASKIETERLIEEQRGAIPVVLLRAAGVYDDLCHSPFIAHQIARIYERSPKSHVYPGDPRAGQSFIHLDDLSDAMLRLVERRAALPPTTALVLGERDAMSYDELQREIGRLVHGKEWQTWQVPKTLAKTGAWVQEEVLREDTFIKPWMVDTADDHYALDTSRAWELLGWQPRHSLRETLPRMVAALKADPAGWYEANQLDPDRVPAVPTPEAAPGRR